MTPTHDTALEKNMESHFKSQRPLKNGRNFLWNSFRHKNNKDLRHYRENFDRIFKNAPGNGV